MARRRTHGDVARWIRNKETAEVLEVAPDTVARDWRLARTWLLQELDPRSKP